MFNSENFNKILKQKNMSLKALSEKTKLDYAGLHRIVHGQTTMISFESLKKICKALECTPNDILKH